ncbi:MAG: protein-L-isoaspartate(D-aspartate) O-methyltransferase [Spirochaetaceae bacterium]|nr:MAG: protein-L-isoaspartate(D-aspartate) O-methyltransferase [Spirochaetaceae bacterium]
MRNRIPACPFPFLSALALLLVLPGTALPADESQFARQRETMVRTQIERRNVTHPATLDAMSRVPRHLFVREENRDRAYSDGPLPIGHGQTISQPYIVALMTQLVDPGPGDRVLEIGTGSGYQAAVLGEILREVYTIEIVEPLYRWGSANLRSAGYDHVRVKHADGYYGWEEHAPFDAIVVTAAASSIPPPLIDQLAEGGKMIIPVGSPFRTQVLTLVRREGNDIFTEQILPVRFVPFVRQ